MTDDSEKVVVAAVGVGLVLALGGAAYAMNRTPTPTMLGAFSFVYDEEDPDPIDVADTKALAALVADTATVDKAADDLFTSLLRVDGPNSTDSYDGIEGGICTSGDRDTFEYANLEPRDPGLDRVDRMYLDHVRARVREKMREFYGAPSLRGPPDTPKTKVRTRRKKSV